MPSPFLEEQTDETAPDYLGLEAPLAFRGQPALPTQGAAPVAPTTSIATPGGEGGPVTIQPAGAPDTPNIAPGPAFPNAGDIAATFGPKLGEVAGRIFGSGDVPAGGIATPSGQITTSAPDILRDTQFPDSGAGGFDPTLVSEPPAGSAIPSSFDDPVGWATLVGSIVAPAISLSGILNSGGGLAGTQGAARQFASGGLGALGEAYADAAVTGDPLAVLGALGSKQGGGAIRSELALPNDMIAALGLPPSQAGRYDWAALTPAQFAAVNDRFRQDPSLIDQWVIGSGDVARLPEADALSVADVAAKMARTMLRHTLGIPEPVVPDAAPVISDFENLANFLAQSGGETGGPEGAPAGSSFGEGGRAFGPSSPLSSNIARGAQFLSGLAPLPGLGFPLGASRATETGLNFLANNFPQLASFLGITGVDVGPVGPDTNESFTDSPTVANTIGFANPAAPTGYSFGRPGVGAATGNAPPGSTNFGDSPSNTSGASPAGGTGIGEGQDAP